MLLALPGGDEGRLPSPRCPPDSGSVHQTKVFGSVVRALLSRHAADCLNDADKRKIKAAYEACVAREQTTSSRQKPDGKHDWYHDLHGDMEESYIDQLLLASMHCDTVDQIRKLRTHVFEHEHELIFDDVLKIIADTLDEIEMLLIGLCPLREQSGNCDDPASRDNRTTKAIAAIFPKCGFLNVSEFCVRTEPRTQRQPECCKSVFSAREFRIRVKLLQMKMILLHRTRGSPKVGPISMID